MTTYQPIKVKSLEDFGELQSLVNLSHCRRIQPGVFLGKVGEKNEGFISTRTTYLFTRNNGDFFAPVLQMVQVPKETISCQRGTVIIPDNLHPEFFENFRNIKEDEYQRKMYVECLSALRRYNLIK